MDLFVSNYVDETNYLYRNEGDGFFVDESATTGLGPTSLPWVGWGTGFLDYDRDGRLDLLVVNGHTESDAPLVDPTTTWRQPDVLYRNRGDGRFEDVTREAAPALLVPRSGRGAVFADLDDDGDLDVVIVNQNERARVYRNDAASDVPWIGIVAEGRASNRDAIGGRVSLHEGAGRRVAEVRAGGSYLSGNDRRVLFALPRGGTPDSVVVRWPDGGRTSLPRPEPGRYHRIVRGAK
jgi:hypothetical protein